MDKFIGEVAIVFAGIMIWRAAQGIYHNAQMPWDSFWSVLFVASPAYVFEIVISLALVVISYCCLMKERKE